MNSTDPSVSTLVNQQFVENMPLNGRSFQPLIALTPGVVFVPTSGSAGGTGEGQFSVNGQRANANYFMVDGVSANFGSTPGADVGQILGGAIPSFNAFGATSGLVSVDAKQEFRVLTSSFAPEYGRTPGGQVLILTRSGTNQFHGTAFDYLRNDIFDARNFFDVPPLPKPPLRQNDFGGTLGGPIRKNKASFFFCERAFGPNQRLSVSYVGAHGINLLREDSIQQSPLGYPTIFATTNGDWSYYSALQVQFQRLMAHGLQALASYTLAKSTDTNSTDVCQCSYSKMLSNVNPAADLGPSDFDVRNSFTAAVSYNVPAPPGRLGHILLGNWTVDALVRSSSAPPFSVMAAPVSPVFGLYYTRADIVPGMPFYIPAPSQPGGRRLNPSAFFRADQRRAGGLARNYFRSYPLNQTDIALSRRFRVSENIVLYARVEYFNVFNHPNFGLDFWQNYIDYAGGTPNPNFGIATATLNNTLGGLNPVYQVGGPRSAQFTLKLTM